MKAGNDKRLAPQRHERLRDIIRRTGAARVEDLRRELRVSPATVRRDLEVLESEGRILRVHGGAVSVESRLEEPLFDDKASLAAREKHRIAQAAVRLIRPGQTLYLDGGSTILELARLLFDRTDVTVVTNSLRAAVELSGRGPRLFIVGGELRRLSQTLVGPLTQAVMEQLRVDQAFMGTMDLAAARGLTTTDPDEAFTKRLVISGAGTVVLLADASKLGAESFAFSGALADIDILVTDKGADRDVVRKLTRRGLRVIQA